MAVAAQWAYRAMAIGTEMVLPGILGLWLDHQLGTKFVFGILGFVLGMVLGIWHLMRMTSQNPQKVAANRGSAGSETPDK